MKKSDLKKLNLPDNPGVYFFLDEKSTILYIGKATSLKNRVASYFASDLVKTRSKLIENMVRDTKTIDFTPTDSVLEALILETNLIRSHKPKFNTKSKDDKSYNHILITKEEWPRILLVRGKDLTEKFEAHEIDCHFGPFPNSSLLRDALKIIRRLFKFYDVKVPLTASRVKLIKGQIEFNRQIGLYPESNDRESYKKTIKHLKLFLKGKKSMIIKELQREMASLAKVERFEEADNIKRKIFALKHIEDISLIKNDFSNIQKENLLRIEAYDVAHLAGTNMVGAMVVLSGSEPQRSEYRKFKINNINKANDPAALSQIIERRLRHEEWPLPNLIVVDGNNIQKSVVEEKLKFHNLTIPVVAVTKNKQHKPERLVGNSTLIKKYTLEMLLANSEAHRFATTFFRQKQRLRALS